MRQATILRNLADFSLFGGEMRAWGNADVVGAPWFKKLLRSRNSVTRGWIRESQRDRASLGPLERRRSLTYQRAVRAWYKKHGWTKPFKHHGRATFVIDPYACMRWYSDNYQREPGAPAYMPPWRKRQRTRRERMGAIDSRFNLNLRPGIDISRSDRV